MLPRMNLFAVVLGCAACYACGSNAFADEAGFAKTGTAEVESEAIEFVGSGVVTVTSEGVIVLAKVGDEEVSMSLFFEDDKSWQVFFGEEGLRPSSSTSTSTFVSPALIEPDGEVIARQEFTLSGGMILRQEGGVVTVTLLLDEDDALSSIDGVGVTRVEWTYDVVPGTDPIALDSPISHGGGSAAPTVTACPGGSCSCTRNGVGGGSASACCEEGQRPHCSCRAGPSCCVGTCLTVKTVASVEVTWWNGP